MRHGGDLVWNIGTGYYGCGTGTTHRMFDETYFRDSLDEANGQVKMIEIIEEIGAPDILIGLLTVLLLLGATHY